MSAASLIADARSYSGNVLSDARDALEAAADAITSIGFSVVSPGRVTLPAPPDTSLSLTAPVLTDVVLDLPGAPTNILTLSDISDIVEGTLPVLSATPPTLTLPSKPAELAAFLQSLPSIDLSAEFPDAPDLIQPEAPTMPVRSEPVKPLITLPSFGGSMPQDAPVAPSDLADTFNKGYREAAPQFVSMVDGYVDAMLAKANPQYHSQMAAIEAQLSRYLQGGTGLATEVEAAIYNRARARNEVEAKKVQDAIFADTAARGFTLPGGAMLAALTRARQDASNNANKTSNEIAVAQAELEQKNLQFAVTTSTGLRTAMLSAMLSYMQNVVQLNGQALDHGKSILGAVVEVYNLSAKAYAVKLDAYKAEAEVYETLRRGAMAAVEIYKAEIDALRTMTQVDMAKVDIYKARIEVMTAMTSMFKTRVDAVVSKAALERLKIDLFQAQVQAHSAQVQAKSAEWQGYTAAIGGQEAVARIYGTQVQAYNAQVQGFAAAIAAKSEVVRAQALTNDARAKQYIATMDGYKTVVQAKGEVARTKIESQRQQIMAFQAETNAKVAQFQVKSEYYKAAASIGIEQSRLDISTLFQSAENMRKYGESVANVAVSTAQVYSGLAGSALAGMNSLAAETTTT